MPSRRDVLRYGSLTLLASGFNATPLSAEEANRRMSAANAKTALNLKDCKQQKRRRRCKPQRDATPITDYHKSSFAAQTSRGHEITHDVYRNGSGAPIVLIQELPGIGKETLRLADDFVDNGFEVVMPHLFGPLGKKSTAGNLARVFCMRKEFSLFSSNKSSPIVDWLKALCQSVRTEKQVDGVGVIGMCLTGNFAISLMGDDSVLAAVAAQPSMPFHNPAALHMSKSEIQATRERIDATAPMLAYRFCGDFISRQSKFDCIKETFNDDDVDRVKLKELPGKKHSVFTVHFCGEDGHPTKIALQEVLTYFDKQLRA